MAVKNTTNTSIGANDLTDAKVPAVLPFRVFAPLVQMPMEREKYILTLQ